MNIWIVRPVSTRSHLFCWFYYLNSRSQLKKFLDKYFINVFVRHHEYIQTESYLVLIFFRLFLLYVVLHEHIRNKFFSLPYTPLYSLAYSSVSMANIRYTNIDSNWLIAIRIGLQRFTMFLIRSQSSVIPSDVSIINPHVLFQSKYVWFASSS